VLTTFLNPFNNALPQGRIRLNGSSLDLHLLELPMQLAGRKLTSAGGKGGGLFFASGKTA
jgi:hypothetical protein